MTPTPQAYLDALLRVNHIDRLLAAYGFDQLASLIRRMLRKSPGRNGQAAARSAALCLITNISNIRSVVPDEILADFARQDTVRNRLARTYNRAARTRVANRVRGCGQAQMALVSREPQPRYATLIPYACNQRSCPACSRHRSAAAFARILDHVAPRIEYRPHEFDLRWMTLDIQSPPWGKLAQALTDLMHAFTRLRRIDSPLWTDNVDGYIFNTEITCNPRARTWHPHIHLVVTGDYIAGPALNRRWRSQLSRRDLRGHAKIGRCYVKDPALRSGRRYPAPHAWSDRDLLGCLLEVCKYTLKPFETAAVPDRAILELHDALQHRRLTGSGGTLRIPTSNPRPYWRNVGGLGYLLDDPESRFHRDPTFRSRLTQAAAQDPARWLSLVRNYPHFYWLQVAARQNDNRKTLTSPAAPPHNPLTRTARSS